MTDNEIIKALEICWIKDEACGSKEDCQYYGLEKCIQDSVEDGIDLIKRQQKRIYHYECSTKNLIKEIMHLKNTMNAIIEQLEAEVESSDKYIREYDDSEFQKAWNEGLRNALEIVKDGAAYDR